ncbi:MAG: ERAP1-like C-terminal domain-containing protein, partial [Acidimicrobiia bacterium]|nr:ERAP1-like C-terminal domain-containing protein [Acidimicrobiia bacterium]
TMDRIIAGEIRNQDSFWLIAVMVGNRKSGDAAWDLVTSRWDELVAVIPPQNLRRVLDSIPARSKPDVADRIRSFLEAHPIPGGELYVGQQLERLDVRVRLRQAEQELPGIV